MKRFRWNESLGFGLRVIDRDHRQLIDLLNRVHSVAVDGPGHEVIATAIDDLADHVAHHFRYEEMLMRLSGYPAYEAHRQLHQYLTDRVAKFQARFRADRGPFPSTSSTSSSPIGFTFTSCART
jgi:hemerythrin